jgi:multidrug efflux pump subunit AcrB
MMGKAVPGGFVPAQDKEYMVAIAQLPNGSSLDRTDAVDREMTEIAHEGPGVESAVQHSPACRSTASPTRPARRPDVPALKPFEGAHGKQSESAVRSRGAQPEVRGHQGRLHRRVPAAAGARARARWVASSCRSRTAVPSATTALNDAVQAFMKKAAKAPELGPTFTSYQINVPQLKVDLDRDKAKQLGVSVTDVFNTMQIFLGSQYVNDFNRFGRVLPGACAGRRTVPRAPGRHRSAEDAQRRRRDDSAVVAGEGEDHLSARNPWCATTATRRRHQRRSGTGLFVRAGAGRRRARSPPKRCHAASSSSGPT